MHLDTIYSMLSWFYTGKSGSSSSTTGASSSAGNTAPGSAANNVPEPTSSMKLLALTNAIGSANMIVLGGHWFLMPDTSTSVLNSRLVVTSGLSLLGHFCVSLPQRVDNCQLITLESSLIAFTTGCMMSTGFNMLLHKKESDRWRFVKRCLGGSLLNFGAFLWVPAFVRLGWQFNHSYLTADITRTGLILNTCKGVLLGAVWDIISGIVNKGVEVGANVIDKLHDKVSEDNISTNDAINTKNSEASLVKKISTALCRPFGGGLLMLGMYLWLPPAARGYFDVSARIRRIIKIIQYLSTWVQ